MKYIQTPGNHLEFGLCSYNDCPCGFPEARIPKGEGFMYVSKEAAVFRKDCLTHAEAELKKRAIAARVEAIIFWDPISIYPILMCEEGAKKLGLDLEVASADAKYWWETGLVPCRPTPLNKSSVQQRSPTVRKWWQFWK